MSRKREGATSPERERREPITSTCHKFPLLLTSQPAGFRSLTLRAHCSLAGRALSSVLPTLIAFSMAALFAGCAAMQNAPCFEKAGTRWEPPADQDQIDITAFEHAMKLVTGGQYAQAAGELSVLLTRLEGRAQAQSQPASPADMLPPLAAASQPTTGPAAGPLAQSDVKMAAECMFWLAYCDEKLGGLAQAAVGYHQVMTAYPSTPAAMEAMKRLSIMPRR